MSIMGNIPGQLTMEITSADPLYTLTCLQNAGIAVYNVQTQDVLTVQFQLNHRDYKHMLQICERNGVLAKILEIKGVIRVFRLALARPILVFGIALLIFLSVWLPTRVFFIRVEGNHTVESLRITETAAQCGLRFGASRRSVRSERMKNALLEALPQLQWAGVNTYGCVAVITVREKEELPQSEAIHPSNIYSVSDAIVIELTVTSGNALVRPGQAVKKGQVLISGYTDLGLHVRFDGAKGEVYGYTIRKISLIMPIVCQERGEIIGSEEKYSVIIGKKRINFFNSSGILDTSCVKIYEEKYITLPGGFILPICIVTEQYVYYETQARQDTPDTEQLCRLSEKFLLRQMIAGQIRNVNFAVQQTQDILLLKGSYYCYEMIGRQRTEEIESNYGKND